jgi:D-serine deaminase-like pyridoxal phosphate-dependent protein
MGVERLLSQTSGLPTPALVVDLEAADRNIAAADVRLRPHLKAHKCPELMRRQLAGGDTTGVTCATAWEAEVAARAGLHDDILVANEVADPGGLASLRRAAEHARITVAIDSPRHLELLDGIDCRVLIEINVGQNRCGMDPGDEAAIVALAERAGPRFRGLQGYEGHAVLLPERPSREVQVERAATILDRLRTLLDCELVSGGGTGTYDLSTHLDEIQAGSYVLMDASYDKLGLPFELALACRTTIVSRNGTRAVCDAGLKALSAEYGLPRAVDPAFEVVELADEHATLQVDGARELNVGDAILLIPAHIDPTVNLHAALHAVAADGSVQRWPVAAARTAAPAP